MMVVVGTLAYTALQQRQYTSTAQVLIQPSGTPQLNQSSQATVSPTDVQTQVQLVTSAPVEAAVARQLGSAPEVSVQPVSQTDVIGISATDHLPHRAAAVANAYSNEYVNYRRTQAVNGLLAAAKQIQDRISDLDGQIAALNAQAGKPGNQTSVQQSVTALTNQQAAYKAQLGQLQLSSAVDTGGAQVVTPARVPTAPSSPRPVRNGLLAVVVGLVLGVALAFLADYLDDSVRTKDDLERASHETPVLGLVPVVSGWKKKHDTRVVSWSDPASPPAEAYRSLRTSIQFRALDRPIQTLQVTSPSSAEGKTTTVANLAVVMAAAGQQVAVVCCDLRRPRIHEFFGLSNEVGFTSVLVGRTTLSGALQPVPGVAGLRLLASGPLPPNPAEVLVSDRAGEVLSSVQAASDVVLVDCPPILPVTDAAALSARVDATLVVASARQTKGKAIGRALELLGQIGAPVVGTVLNGATADDAYGYEYRYRYYQSDRGAPVGDGRQPRWDRDLRLDDFKGSNPSVGGEGA
jgi:capsular exopolysaccharide synthesis family protein